MPIEIRELVVKVNVEDRTKKTGLSAKELQELKSRIIKECTEKVLQKLANASDR